MSTSACKTSISFPPPIILHKSGVTIDTTLADPVHHCPLVPSYHREVIRRRCDIWMCPWTFVWRPKTPSSSKTHIWLAERDDLIQYSSSSEQGRMINRLSQASTGLWNEDWYIYYTPHLELLMNGDPEVKVRSWASIRFKDEVAPAQAEGRS